MRRTSRSLAALLASAVLLALAGCNSVSSNNEGAQSVAAPGAAVAAPVDIYVAQTEPAAGLAAVSVPGGVIYMQRVPVLTRADLTDAAAMADQQGRNFVGLRFTDAGARKLASAGADNMGKMLALVVGRQLVAAPRITESLNHGVLAFGVPTRKEAMEIAARIRGEQPPARPMPLPAKR